MKKLDSKAFSVIRNWIYRNARALELSLWQYHFENGSKDAVLRNLAFYQNSDGGFGNTLEPDNWNPNSTPYTTTYAMNILEGIDFTDTEHPIMCGIIKFLESDKCSFENGWLFSIPSNNDYAHAPWWTYDEQANQTESIGTTAEIVSFIFKYVNRETELYQRAVKIAQNIINKITSIENYGDMGIHGYCVLADTIKQTGLDNIISSKPLMDNIHKLVYDSIERDTSKWLYYGVRPSNYISSPSSDYYHSNMEIVQAELDYLIDTRPQDGVWGITWSWFENNEKYLKEFAISENWWKAAKAIEKLIFLRNFNRIDTKPE